MPKINQEEYEILKEIRRNDFEEIRRNGTGDIGVRVIGEKVTRHQYQTEHNDKFKFLEATGVYWSIAELIEEYEKESEETEVKSKQELIEKWESAIEAAEFYGKGKEEKLISYMKDFVSDLNQLNEPEVLSQEWIDEHKLLGTEVDEDGRLHQYHYIHVDDIPEILVPKQEEIKIDRAHDKIREESSLSDKSFDYYWNCIANDVEMYEVEEVEMKDLNEVINKLEGLSEAYQNKPLDAYTYGFLNAVEIAIFMLRRLIEPEEEQKYYVIDTDDLEISDGNHYLTQLSLSKDDMELPIVGYKDDAIPFENKEQAQAIADYVGGRVEELEE